MATLVADESWGLDRFDDGTTSKEIFLLGFFKILINLFL